MRIALFTDTFLPQTNGVTKTLDRLSDYFEKQGIEYLIFTPEDEGEVKKNTESFYSFNFFLYPECKLATPNYFRVKRVLNEFQPDLIHLVTPFNMGLCGLKYAKSFEVPIVASYHTNFTKYLDYYNLNFLEKPIWYFFKWFHNHSRLNLCPSQTTLNELVEKGFSNLKIWGRAIDTELYSPKFRDEKLEKKYELEDKLVLLYVGRLAAEKNLNLLLKSLKKLNQKYQKQIKLVITGEGPLATKLKSEAPANVVFTGYLKGHELAKVYATADVFVFPSLTETYGNVVLEAFASGLPVVAIAAGGVKENLIDEYNGLAVSSNSLSEFTSALQRIILNKRLRKQLAINARKYALTKSWQQVFRQLITDYQQVIIKNQDVISA